METENKILLELGVEGGGAEIYKTYKGLYKNGENLYVIFQDALENLMSDIHHVTPLFIDKEICDELTEIINTLLVDGRIFNAFSLRNWEIWLNKKFYNRFTSIEYQQLELQNIFGEEHNELHHWLEKLLQEYLYFHNIVDSLKPDIIELEYLLKQHSFTHSIFLKYGEILFGWCLNTENEQLDPIYGYGEVELSKIKIDKKIFTDQTIKGLFLNNETNQREIAFSDYSIVLKEEYFKEVKQNLLNSHLAYSNSMLNIISGEQNGFFKLFEPRISGVISTKKALNYNSALGQENVYFTYKILLENPPFEQYDFPSARFDNHQIWKRLFKCFNNTISYACLYDTLIKSGFNKIESLGLSGLENETHLKLSQLLREKYTDTMD